MPDVRKCAIYGCRSNSRENKDLKYFNFPARENPFYDIWLKICHESKNSIRSLLKPYICSKHFHQTDVGFRRLAVGALPALYLKAPPGFAKEENARRAEEAAIKAKKQHQIDLVNDTVLEWSRRAQHYAKRVAQCRTRRELLRVGRRARNLIGATLEFYIDDYWLRKFRQSHMSEIDEMDLDDTRNKSVDISSIIHYLDPKVGLLSEEDIALLVKEEERRRIVQTDLNGQQMVIRKRSHAAKLNGSGGNMDNKAPFTIKVCSYDLDDNEAGEDSLEDAESPETLITSYKQALEHLKPLEDFILREENYRAIGLLSMLEIIFTNPIKTEEIHQRADEEDRALV